MLLQVLVEPEVSSHLWLACSNAGHVEHATGIFYPEALLAAETPFGYTKSGYRSDGGLHLNSLLSYNDG